MTKLSDTQLVILSAAAARKDRAVLPLPDTLQNNGGAATSSLKGLLRRKLVEEQPARVSEPAWREDGDKRRALFVTSEGLAALGIDESSEGDEKAPSSRKTAAKPAKTTKAERKRNTRTPAAASTSSGAASSGIPATKRELLVELLSRPEGATSHEMQEATGWLPHTVRAAISGLRKGGLNIVRRKDPDGSSRYAIVDAPGDSKARATSCK